MTDSQTNDVRATFTVTDLTDKLHVLQFEAYEAVSELFEVHLVVASAASQIAFSSVVGKAGLLTITRDSGTRYFHGMVSAFQQQDHGRKFTVYQVSLVPRVWRLLHRADCRIFQELTTEKIVTKVLDAAGIDSSTYEIKLENNTPTPTWNYCVQYRETDWAFISRLLEEMGFFYFFQHTGAGHKLTIGNNYQFHPTISGEASVTCHEPSPLLPDAEQIIRFFFRENIRSGKVTLHDFNPLKPSLNLRSAKESGQDASLEVYDFPGEYGIPKVGEQRATTRLQSIQAMRRVGHGDSDCIRLAAGHHFKLTAHFRADLTDKQYMLTRVTHHGDKNQDLESGAVSERIQYSNSFHCIPRKVPFRPLEISPKPTAVGVQTAVVVGKKGEEIHTDQYGRVKVQFHWDRKGKKDEHSSCWIRVSQIWASQGWGGMWIPRIGDEVIVDFIEGDPDRPIIAGRVYHAQNMPPYVLPDKKTVSTIKSNSSLGGGGYNEIRFEDEKGSEEVFTHAQKDQNEVVRNNMSTRVGNNQSLNVGHDRTKTIVRDETTKVGRNRTETVVQDETITITGNRTEIVVKNEKVTVGGERTETVTGNQVETVLQNNIQTVLLTSNENVGMVKTLSAGVGYVLSVGAAMTSTVGSLHETVVGGVVESVGKSKAVTVGDTYELTCGTSKITVDKGGTIKLSGSTKIELSVGGSSISITPGMIDIKSTLVKINS